MSTVLLVAALLLFAAAAIGVSVGRLNLVGAGLVLHRG